MAPLAVEKPLIGKDPGAVIELEELMPGSSRSFWPKVILLAGASLAALAVAIALVIGGDWFQPHSPSSSLRTPPSVASFSTPFVMPGLQRPPAQPAGTVNLPDDAEVLGVSAGGRHRAYLVAALSGISSHVVNDLLGDVPVTVTCCDRTQYARVFTAEGRTSPLNVDLGGLFEGKKLIKVGDVFYPQQSGEQSGGKANAPFPYPDYPFLRTTWKQWKEAHPETDIYVGALPGGKESKPDDAKPADRPASD